MSLRNTQSGRVHTSSVKFHFDVDGETVMGVRPRATSDLAVRTRTRLARSGDAAAAAASESDQSGKLSCAAEPRRRNASRS